MNSKLFIRRILRKIIGPPVGPPPESLGALREEISSLKMLIAKNIQNSIRSRGIVSDLKEVEFKVFSQWGDDGIIQYLTEQIQVSSNKFIEFGVENYLESNTRFLLMNNNWDGLVMDGSQEHIDFIRNDSLYWKYNLKALQAFVTKDNINDLILSAGFSGNIGLLHIDIDGNDYWIWDAIKVISADIVVVEYNSLLGAERAITIPYAPDFVRGNAHYSNLYAGASLPALYHLAHQKGYVFVGCNSAGNNAYFVKKEKSDKLHVHNLQTGYVPAKFREARSRDGKLMFLSPEESLSLIKGLPVYNVKTGLNEII